MFSNRDGLNVIRGQNDIVMVISSRDEIENKKGEGWKPQQYGPEQMGHNNNMRALFKKCHNKNKKTV